jgi:uncharacterized membrane protein YphA (DoxX/SURF4 family)
MQGANLPGIAALVTLAARFVLAFIFLRAGIAKLSDLSDFRTAVANYQILPARLNGTAARAVPVAELTAGLLLLLGVLPGITAAFLAALLAIFSVAIIINLARGRVFDCGCGGTAPRQISWRHVAVNLALAASAVAVALAPPAALDAVAGPAGAFSVSLPHGSGIPVLLTVSLGLVMASMFRAALTALRAR